MINAGISKDLLRTVILVLSFCFRLLDDDSSDVELSLQTVGLSAQRWLFPWLCCFWCFQV